VPSVAAAPLPKQLLHSTTTLSDHTQGSSLQYHTRINIIEMPRNICITGDGHTGHLIAELILTDTNFKNKVDSVNILALHPTSEIAKELAELGK
jgi:hypothetical protein